MTAVLMNGKPVILLNADHNPHQQISYQKAANLLARDKAVIVESDPAQKFGNWLLPKVMRLKEYVYIAFDKINGPPMPSKRGVLDRDGRVCQFTHCNAKATTIDHVHPRSKGGKNFWENLVGACSPCNRKKGNRTMAEMGWQLKRQPYAPTRVELRRLRGLTA